MRRNEIFDGPVAFGLGCEPLQKVFINFLDVGTADPSFGAGQTGDQKVKILRDGEIFASKNYRGKEKVVSHELLAQRR